jgi:thiol-disulfide isomerase/thioredoxin
MTFVSRLLHRRNLALASLFLGLAFSAPAAAAEEKEDYGKLIRVIPKEFPALSLFQQGKENAETVADWKGQVVILNFWATWCGPCVQEMPSLNALAKQYEGKKLRIIPASQDVTGFLTIKTFYRRQKLDALPVYWDKDTEAFKALGVTILPISYILGKDGRVIGHVKGGYDWESDEMKQFIDRVLEQ